MTDTAFKVVHFDGLIEHHDPAAGTLRLEMGGPSRVRPGMSAAAADEEPTVHHFGDKGLARLRTTMERLVEDAKRDGKDCRANERHLRVILALQYVRRRLRMRYGARDAYGVPGDRGTDVYDHWLRHDDPPSYALAFSIDRDRFNSGKSHIVAWGKDRGKVNDEHS